MVWLPLDPLPARYARIVLSSSIASFFPPVLRDGAFVAIETISFSRSSRSPFSISSFSFPPGRLRLATPSRYYFIMYISWLPPSVCRMLFFLFRNEDRFAPRWGGAARFECLIAVSGRWPTFFVRLSFLGTLWRRRYRWIPSRPLRTVLSLPSDGRLGFLGVNPIPSHSHNCFYDGWG